METKGVTCKIPLALHNRITEEIRQNESTMSKFIEQIILEHYTKGATTMGKTRTLAFQVIEQALAEADEEFEAAQAIEDEAEAMPDTAPDAEGGEHPAENAEFL